MPADGDLWTVARWSVMVAVACNYIEREKISFMLWPASSPSNFPLRRDSVAFVILFFRLYFGKMPLPVLPEKNPKRSVVWDGPRLSPPLRGRHPPRSVGVGDVSKCGNSTRSAVAECTVHLRLQKKATKS